VISAGFIPVAKPEGITSSGVVQGVRRRLPRRTKIGHCGTLDPSATGLLILAVGAATRLAEYIMRGEKEYRARIRLGVETDSYDLDGKVIRESPVPPLDETALREVLDHFTGCIEQVPPRISALKQGGEPLYRKVRRGEKVEVAPRQVEIKSIKLVGRDENDIIVTVNCGSGTYIRSLAHDLGERLGCGGAIVTLERLRSGEFTAAQAVSYKTLMDEDPEKYIIPLAKVFTDWPKRELTQEEAVRVRHGGGVLWAAGDNECPVRLMAEEKLVALGRCVGEELRPFKVLHPAN